MEALDQYKADLEELKQKQTHVQIKLEESVESAKKLKETLAKMGYNSLAEAKEAYSKLLSDAESKHEEVKNLILEIKNIENKVLTRDEVLAKLKENSLDKTKETESKVQEEINSETKTEESPESSNDIDFLQSLL